MIGRSAPARFEASVASRMANREESGPKSEAAHGTRSASRGRRAREVRHEGRSGGLSRRRVYELMNPDVVCARPGMTAGEVARLLAERRVGGAPVVNERGRILGIVTQSDLARYLSQRVALEQTGSFYSDLEEYQDLGHLRADRSRTPVEDLMQRRVYKVDRDASVAMAANIMRERRVHRLLVTDRGLLVGVISALDLLRVVEEAMTSGLV